MKLLTLRVAVPLNLNKIESHLMIKQLSEISNLFTYAFIGLSNEACYQNMIFIRIH